MVGGGELDDGVLGAGVLDGSTVVGATDVVWTTVDGAFGDGALGLDVKEKGVEGALLLLCDTEASQYVC